MILVVWMGSAVAIPGKYYFGCHWKAVPDLYLVEEAGFVKTADSELQKSADSLLDNCVQQAPAHQHKGLSRTTNISKLASHFRKGSTLLWVCLNTSQKTRQSSNEHVREPFLSGHQSTGAPSHFSTFSFHKSLQDGVGKDVALANRRKRLPSK